MGEQHSLWQGDDVKRSVRANERGTGGEYSDKQGGLFGAGPPPAASGSPNGSICWRLFVLASWIQLVVLLFLFASAAGVREWLSSHTDDWSQAPLLQFLDSVGVPKAELQQPWIEPANISFTLPCQNLSVPGSLYAVAQNAGKYLVRAANEREPPEVVVPPYVKDPQTGKTRKILPEERAELMCRSVWTEYAAFHNMVTSDMREKGQTAPHRLAVFRKGRAMFGEGGGLGDTASAHVTVLIFSMLTGRVFQEYWVHHDEVFYSPYINTTYTEKEEYLDLQPEREGNTFIVSQDGRAAASASQVASAGETFNFLMTGAAWETGDLNRGPFNRTVEIFDMNKGITHLLWDHKPTANHLFSLGLKPDTTYGCLSHFLLRPTEGTREKMRVLMDAMTEPEVMTISIHVRTDYTDYSFQVGGRGEDNTTTFWAPFQCAQEIEKMYLEKGKRVIWYIATDSKKLRDDAVVQFGSNPEKRQVLFMEDPPKHIGLGEGVTDDGKPCPAFKWNCHSPDFVPNLRTTFVDWYILSLADFHVVTDSGLGTTASGRSMLTNTTFKVSNGQWPPLEAKPGDPLCMSGPTPWRDIQGTRGAFK